ncbi:MAG TPA: SET domain-containing protein [Bryobacteraceae bacterium]|nr:SET domain-containing protein [Bryobacteraceae bacterium]
MIHPDTELRFISREMGYGLFAAKPIPRGTITWVGDALDQIVSTERFADLPGPLRSQAYKYSYVNGRGDRILCWDHGRFVNHSCAANCLSPGFDFEIAVRDIGAGEEITDDYGTLNLEEPFDCLCHARTCRGSITPDDPLRCAPQWDASLASAFSSIPRVDQPLWELVCEKGGVSRVLAGEIPLPSVLAYYRR